jgi:hypothetical protein
MKYIGKDARILRVTVVGLLLGALLAGAGAFERARADSSPFAANAMWIWQLPKAERGNRAAIVRRARKSNIRTLFIKAGDGRNNWRQFTPSMVRYFHDRGLKVCGWHYVYGRRPATEATVSANAIRDGADCMIIDAEAEYEGRYSAADTYMTSLREQVGGSTPVALAGFPYVDYHPGFPYSVFFRPGGAQYNLPQMYWRAIGTSVERVFTHTYRWNQPYDRPIYPLGQIWQRPPARDIKRFRRLAMAYGATGTSWWEWSQGSRSAFKSATRVLGAPPSPRLLDPVTLGRGARGDVVVWAQEHLNGAGAGLPVTGNFGTGTRTAVRAFQTTHGLPVTGVLDPATWTALLRVEPASTPWASLPARRSLRASSASASVASTDAPASARLPARRNELGGRRR